MYLYGKCREWAVDRSQNMGPNYGNIFGHLGLSHKGPCILALKLCELNGLVCVEINLESWSIKELMG